MAANERLSLLKSIEDKIHDRQSRLGFMQSFRHKKQNRADHLTEVVDPEISS